MLCRWPGAPRRVGAVGAARPAWDASGHGAAQRRRLTEHTRQPWEAQAIDQAAGFLHDDPDGIHEMLDAVARLADKARPAGSFSYGSPDRRRLRIGRYRVMYDITAETVSVWHLGRGWAGS